MTYDLTLYCVDTGARSFRQYKTPEVPLIPRIGERVYMMAEYERPAPRVITAINYRYHEKEIAVDVTVRRPLPGDE